MPSRQSKRKAANRADEAAQDVVQGLQEATLKERTGTDFAAALSSALFFEDKTGAPVRTDQVAAAAAKPAAGRKARKPLKSEAILVAGRATKTVVPELRRRKGSAALKQKVSQPSGQLRTPPDAAALDLWGIDQPGSAAAKRRKRSAATAVAPPAVAVDGPGCSYNPDTEQHQDAVAVAVAAEIQKAIAQELQPRAPPVHGDGDAQLDELALLQVQEDVHDDEGEHADAVAAAAGIDRRPSERKTKTQRNKEERRRQAEADLHDRRQQKEQNKAIAKLSQLQSEADAADAALQAKLLRKQVALAAKRAVEPPRLGKHLFKPEPMQVLLSEELNGSLRTLKATPTLTRERFKSLQQRGMIESRVPRTKKVGRRIASEKFANR